MELMPSSLYARNLTATAHTTTPRAGRVPTDKDDGLSSRKACGLGDFEGRFCLPVGGIGDKTTKTTNFTLENDLEGSIEYNKLLMILTPLIMIDHMMYCFVCFDALIVVNDLIKVVPLAMVVPLAPFHLVGIGERIRTW